LRDRAGGIDIVFHVFRVTTTQKVISVVISCVLFFSVSFNALLRSAGGVVGCILFCVKNIIRLNGMMGGI